jgi:hypothetical protein
MFNAAPLVWNSQTDSLDCGERDDRDFDAAEGNGERREVFEEEGDQPQSQRSMIDVTSIVTCDSCDSKTL